ncbi:UDP-N-acetylgalactosamine-undecaprenyl-phosphate N-acetylgalactosaminephosphotransferase [compost metagenome]
MSVVGPRPERPEFTRLLAQEIPFYSRRHMVPPGLTGWAQVMCPYAASVEDSVEKHQYDLFYIKNRSFYLDLKIMLKTVGVMVNKIGAR